MKDRVVDKAFGDELPWGVFVFPPPIRCLKVRNKQGPRPWVAMMVLVETPFRHLDLMAPRLSQTLHGQQ
jgi:hypothetical protein